MHNSRIGGLASCMQVRLDTNKLGNLEVNELFKC